MTVQQSGRPIVGAWLRDGGFELLSGLTIAFQISESMTPPNNFVITLAPSQGKQSPASIVALDRLSKRLRPNSVVAIGFERSGDLFLGLVSSCKRTINRSGSGEGSSSVVVITGQDLVGKALTRDNIILSLLSETADAAFFAHCKAVFGPNHPLLVQMQSQFGPTGGPGAPDRGSAYWSSRTIAEAVQWIVSSVPALVIPMLRQFGGTGHIGDYLTVDLVAGWNDGRLWTESPQTFSGNLLGFIRSAIDQDFYEVFTTSVPNQTDLPSAVLVVRPKPYDDPILRFAPVLDDPGIAWPALKTRIDGKTDHIVRNSDIHVEDVEFADDSTFAWYTCSAVYDLLGNSEQDSQGLRWPLIDTYAATSFGATAYQAQSTLISDPDEQVEGDPASTADITKRVFGLRNRLFNWHRLNAWFLNGSVTMAGRPKIRVGDPVRFVDWQAPLGQPDINLGKDIGGIRAYIVSVNHQWELGGTYTTTIQFTRGYNTGYLRAVLDIIKKDAALYGVTPLHYAAAGSGI